MTETQTQASNQAKEPKSTKKSQARVAGKYQPPVPDVGDPVHYFSVADNRNPVPGRVQKIGYGSIDISTIDAAGRVQIVHGARHIDDPALTNEEIRRHSGAWDFSPFYKKVAKLLKK